MGAYVLEPHGWLGRASEGGSNDTLCQQHECGQLRLDKVHAGFAPRFLDPQKPEHPFVTNEVDLIPAVQAWDEYSRTVRELIISKSKGYGNAWQGQGYMGNLARVLSKADRLKELLWRDTDPFAKTEELSGEETVLDTLLDIGPLAAFAIANIDDGNRWGRG